MWLVSIMRKIMGLFKKKKHVTLALYGPPNGGKTTLANRICADWLGEEMGTTSRIAHETRAILQKQRVTIRDDMGRSLTFTLVDTPGIASRIDAEDFVKEGMPERESRQRAKEASVAVVESLKWLGNADCVVLVLDGTKEPHTQVNAALVEYLINHNVPMFIVANKIDLKKANTEKIRSIFVDIPVLGISAKYGDHIEEFYEHLFILTEQVKHAT